MKHANRERPVEKLYGDITTALEAALQAYDEWFKRHGIKDRCLMSKKRDDGLALFVMATVINNKVRSYEEDLGENYLSGISEAASDSFLKMLSREEPYFNKNPARASELADAVILAVHKARHSTKGVV